jgi:hypothetical protein|tara:strand:- start:5168 stop:5392 length:225 start_codon:yes stop_codon:yes gene_type:complete
MRYTVTFEVYVQGDNDKHAYSKANLIAKNQNALHPNQDWSVYKLHRTPFASLNVQEVDIDKLDLEKFKNEESPF